MRIAFRIDRGRVMPMEAMREPHHGAVEEAAKHGYIHQRRWRFMCFALNWKAQARALTEREQRPARRKRRPMVSI
jgi:hypothetical protein